MFHIWPALQGKCTSDLSQEGKSEENIFLNLPKELNVTWDLQKLYTKGWGDGPIGKGPEHEAPSLIPNSCIKSCMCDEGANTRGSLRLPHSQPS